MTIYKNLGGDSNVVAFDVTVNSITVEFKSGNTRFYLYDETKPGIDHVNAMKKLANEGKGLNSYIATNLRSASSYARKW